MDTNDYQDFFNDMEMIKEKINANEFEINNFPVELNKILDKKIEIAKNKYNNILNQKEILIKNKGDIQVKEKLLNKEKQEIESRKCDAEDKIKLLDENKVNELKKKKVEIQNSMEKINEHVK